MRGNSSHGWGSKKKHRGAGHRGGRGNAGSGKRADQKKPTFLKLYGNSYFGKSGFKRPQKVLEKINVINLGDLNKKIDYFVGKKLVKKEGEFYVVDLDKLGYQKLLGGGKLDLKLKVKAQYITEKAVKKIESKKGVIEKDESPSK